jgi:hypothetical protein
MSLKKRKKLNLEVWSDNTNRTLCLEFIKVDPLWLIALAEDECITCQ